MDASHCCKKFGTNVLGAGYAEHERPYHFVDGAGLDCYLFRLQTDGAARVVVDNRVFCAEAGDLLMFAPGQSYELHIDVDRDPQMQTVYSTDLYLFCDGHWLDNWWHSRSRSTHVKLSLQEQCVHLWRQLIEEHRRPGGADGELSDYLLRALCLTIDRVAQDAAVAAPIPLAAERMRWFIERHAPEDITLREVAEAAGISVSRAVHIFKDTYQETIVQYLLNVRLQMACDRMRFSTFNLEQIADLCGFRSYSYFYRVFRSRYGISPRAFRERAQ
ncbi:helix-turn-helix transcriptional regulator [Alicyclobacillus fodiniaquatilis]|uniref:AraC family transcriptional regulator n=1 Tax=Alicyclobacillus fodiniaquatilis TaxID=1661150 RepID=A0ABW4JEX0_9BACL